MQQIRGVVIMLMFVVSVCISQTNTEHKPVIRGYELYSWRDTRGDWAFSLLPNTSSEKTVAVVFGEKNTLHSVEQLECAMAKLPEGEHLFWFDRIPSGTGPRAKGSEGLMYPPLHVMEEIKRFSKSHGILLEILPSR